MIAVIAVILTVQKELLTLVITFDIQTTKAVIWQRQHYTVGVALKEFCQMFKGENTLLQDLALHSNAASGKISWNWNCLCYGNLFSHSDINLF